MTYKNLTCTYQKKIKVKSGSEERHT
jgi:hypothetical protein